MKFGLWQEQKLRALHVEHGAVVMGLYERGAKRIESDPLLRHVRREIDFYEMWLHRPDFERLEAEARELKRLARKVTRLVKHTEHRSSQ